jgi:hypothetical protein
MSTKQLIILSSSVMISIMSRHRQFQDQIPTKIIITRKIIQLGVIPPFDVIFIPCSRPHNSPYGQSEAPNKRQSDLLIADLQNTFSRPDQDRQNLPSTSHAQPSPKPSNDSFHSSDDFLQELRRRGARYANDQLAMNAYLYSRLTFHENGPQ